MLHIGVNFVLRMGGCGRTADNDRDICLLGLGSEGLTRWRNPDRRQGERAIRVLGRCPVTDVVPTVQPEVETVSR